MKGFVFLGLIAMACNGPGSGQGTKVSQGNDDPDPPAGDTDEPEPPDPTLEDCASEELGPDGGVVLADGAVLDLPEGALARDELVELCWFEDPSLLSARWEIRPSGLELEVAGTLTLEHTGDELVTHLFTPNPDGVPSRNLEQLRPAQGSVEGPLYRFGEAWVGEDLQTAAVYTPELGDAVDLLFVVDNSCSMSDFQAALGSTMSLLMPDLVASSLDFHVGVVATDLDHPNYTGKLREAAGVRWVESTTPSPELVFAAMANIGTEGSGTEQGLGAAYMAIGVLGSNYNLGFERPNAPLAVVVLSDEDDQTSSSLISSDEFVDWFDNVKPNVDGTALHGIVSPLAGTGVSYTDIAISTGGTVTDIDAANWTPFLEAILDPFDGGQGGMPLRAVEGSVEAWWLAGDAEPERLDAADVDHDAVEARVWVALGGRQADEVVLIFEPL